MKLALRVTDMIGAILVILAAPTLLIAIDVLMVTTMIQGTIEGAGTTCLPPEVIDVMIALEVPRIIVEPGRGEGDGTATRIGIELTKVGAVFGAVIPAPMSIMGTLGGLTCTNM